jgi:hypothetical protein
VLGIILDEVGNNLVGEIQELLIRLAVSHSELVLPPDVAGQVADVLVAPEGEVAAGSLEEV